MSRLKPIHLAFLFISLSNLSVFGQWSPVDSGTTSNLNGAILLDSGTGFVVGDTGTILKSTDAGATWAPLASGTSTTLHGIYFLDPNDGIAFGGGFSGAQMLNASLGVVAGQNSIFQALYGNTTDGGASWSFLNFYFDGNEGGANDVFFFDLNTIGLVSGTIFDGRGALSRTTDGGLNWSTTLYDQ